MRILGLTGDIACGKSTVAKWLSEHGAATLDSDWLVRELYQGQSFARRVQALFEAPILDSAGGVDRLKLGALVFQDAGKLRALEALVHPAVADLRACKLRELAAAGQKIVVVEAVKLLESGQSRACEAVWCVVCEPRVQLKRLMENRGLDENQARLRLEHQPSREAKAVWAQQTPLVWLENNGSLDELRAAITREWTRFLA